MSKIAVLQSNKTRIGLLLSGGLSHFYFLTVWFQTNNNKRYDPECVGAAARPPVLTPCPPRTTSVRERQGCINNSAAPGLQGEQLRGGNPTATKRLLRTNL